MTSVTGRKKTAGNNDNSTVDSQTKRKISTGHKKGTDETFNTLF